MRFLSVLLFGAIILALLIGLSAAGGGDGPCDAATGVHGTAAVAYLVTK